MEGHEVYIDGVLYVPKQEQPLPPGYLSPHFRETEFSCNHCNLYGDLISRELIEVLEKVRAHFGHPVIVNSGVRCDTHNANVGGATNSRHRTGYADAADIVVKDVPAYTVHKWLIDAYPDRYGIGAYPSFTHIDVRPGGPARWTG